MKNYLDIYELPFHMNPGIDWVYDKKNQFAFQFQIDDDEKNKKMLDVINSTGNFENKDLKFSYSRGCIFANGDIEVILIRGWGNLTGSGGHNLSSDEASNVQDTLANFILDRLNDRTKI